MQLLSHAFRDGAMIPRKYTCDGDDTSPPLEWSGMPPAAKSFVLLCDDPDAPGGVWHHWAAYDIPADMRFLPEGAAQRSWQRDFKQAINDFEKDGYGGPCPPHDHGLHHYHFRLLALSVDRLKASKGASCSKVEREARKHAIAEATLVGVYER